jgi:shikimate kinase
LRQQENACWSAINGLSKGVQALRQIENIALIGFMGAGKTTVGHAVAALLGFQMVDTDELIEKRAAKRITEIFRQEGEARFREYERQVVAMLCGYRRTVIATGGGLPVNAANLSSLRTHSLVVYLWASPETIWERVGHQGHRPLLHDRDPMAKIRQLLNERVRFYRQADVLVSTESRSVREVAIHVAQHFRLSQSDLRDERSHSTPIA